MTDYKILAIIEQKMHTKAKTFLMPKEFLEEKATLKIMWNYSKTYITHFFIDNFKEDIPDDIVNLKEVIWLKFSDCDFEKAPEWVAEMSKLENLTIFRCKTSLIPDEYSKLVNLSTLLLDSNEFQSIPKAICRLPKLKRLSFHSNRDLLEIPEEICQLVNLDDLDMNFCTVKNIPYGLVKINFAFILESEPGRDGIHLFGATLADMDINLFKQSRNAIEAYYTGPQVDIKECKIVFLGDGDAGKSSIIERIMYNRFDKNKKPTEGIKILNWQFDLESGENITLRMLDFGGQEIMHAMHRCFLTQKTVYIIVCESRNDSDIDRTAERWLETVKAFAEDCPVILALNKCDLNPHVSVNERNLRSINENLTHIIKVSAALDKNNGIENLLSAIRQEIKSNVEYLSSFNKNWLGIKQELDQMTSDYITDDVYRAICEKYTVNDRKIQDEILDWFMCLGVAYHYHTVSVDNALENFMVLSPGWLTNGIYRLILRTPESDGMLSHRDIKNVLKATNPDDMMPEKVYSPQETEFILHVMRRFQISHDMGGGRELMPLKMKKDAPESANLFNLKTALHISWKANYIPNTVIHKLMIRKFNELDKTCMWRSGARFVDKINNREALVEMSEQKLDVYVNASNDKRVYMEELRKYILEIMFELNLSYTEVIYCTVNNKMGEVPYLDVLTQYNDGVEKVFVSNIKDYAQTKAILHEAYTENTLKKDNATYNFYGNNTHFQNASGINSTITQSMVDYRGLAENIAKRDYLEQDEYDKIIEYLRLITNEKKLSWRMQAKTKKVVRTCENRTSKSNWLNLREFISDLANLATIATAAITYGPELINHLKNIF